MRRFFQYPFRIAGTVLNEAHSPRQNEAPHRRSISFGLAAVGVVDMVTYRAIWLFFFGIGAYALGSFVHAFDAWASSTAFAGAELYCRGTLAGHIPITRTPLCLSVWFIEAKSWLGYAIDMLVNAGGGLYRAEVLRTADIGLMVLGAFSACVALAWLWATAMAQVVVAVFAASFTLTQGLSHILRRRAA